MHDLNSFSLEAYEEGTVITILEMRTLRLKEVQSISQILRASGTGSPGKTEPRSSFYTAVWAVGYASAPFWNNLSPLPAYYNFYTQ